jgi:dolichyl-phosphate beta-glucosyltransferase
MLSVVLFLILIGLPLFILKLYPLSRKATKSEGYYVDPKTGRLLKFPKLNDKPTVKLSIIIPAYNEEKRLPLMMKETMAYIDKRSQHDETFSFEIIIVDDGSKDNTTKVFVNNKGRYRNIKKSSKY